MNVSDSGICNGGGLETLLKAAKFVEEQEKEKQRNHPNIVRTNGECETIS